MRAIVVGLAVSLGCAGQALAEDHVLLAPPAAWVQPSGPVKTTAPDDGAAVRFLRVEQQVHFGPDGATRYTETAERVQTPQGLQALSTISLPWDPALGSLTVHKLHILRDGQEIDVLAKQSFTVLRREKNLEAQTLDGVLTAVLQPEDLRVGDVIDLAVSLTTKDPALAGHVQWTSSPPNVPIDELKLNVTAEQKPVQWRANEGIDGLKPGVTVEGRSLSVSMSNVQPVLLPANAPRRFQWARMVQFSDFKSWAEVSAVMDPLFAKAEAIGPASPLQAEIARIKAASADPKTRAEAALALVQNQVRYVLLAMDDGGYVPADADATWKRRFGDCKGKTTLLLTLLKGLGIEAQPALVASKTGDGLDQRLPSLSAFDHVIVRATIGGRVYWLDGTRLGDRHLDDIRTPAFVWALPVQAAPATLVKLTPAPYERPMGVRTFKIDASAGLEVPAPTHAETLIRGDQAFQLNASLANLAPAQRDAVLRKFWQTTFAALTPTTVAANYDPAANEVRFVADGTVKMEWRDGRTCCRTYQADGSGLGFKADFTRSPGPHADAPYAVNFPFYEQTLETIVLPNQGKGFIIEGGPVDKTVGAWSFQRKAAIVGGVFTLDASARTLASEFTPGPDDANVLTALTKAPTYVISPRDYRMTSKELDVYAARSLTTADEFVRRGVAMGQGARFSQARDDLQKAVALDPKMANAWANLAIARVSAGDLGGAREALGKAVSLKPDDAFITATGAFVAEAIPDNAEAVRLLSKALDAKPGDVTLLRRRADAYRRMKDFDKALADIDALLKSDPTNDDRRRLKIETLFEAGRPDQALAEADAFIAATPRRPLPHRVKASILARLDRAADASAEYDKALDLNKTAAGYLNRAFDQPVKERAARLADVTEALRLEPNNATALERRAVIEGEMGQYDKALAEMDDLIGKTPDSIGRHALRAHIYAEAGKLQPAAADLDWVRAHIPDTGADWNGLCFDEAAWNLTLDKALSDCDKALSLSARNAAFLDNRALVLFRLGRMDDALRDYDRALQLNPFGSASLFGRALIRMGKGQVQEGRADLVAARRLDPRIDETFAQYGVTLPAAYASSNSATK